MSKLSELNGKKRIVKPAVTVSATAARTSKSQQEKLFEIDVPVKAKRARVPKDFATQYGESTESKAPRKTAEETPRRRPRRDALMRQKIRDIMEPGDELVARLRRAGAIAGVDEENGANGERRVVRSTTPRRPRKWEARCGKCGNKSIFLTAAGLCARCGAIMVREK